MVEDYTGTEGDEPENVSHVPPASTATQPPRNEFDGGVAPLPRPPTSPPPPPPQSSQGQVIGHQYICHICGRASFEDARALAVHEGKMHKRTVFQSQPRQPQPRNMEYVPVSPAMREDYGYPNGGQGYPQQENGLNMPQSQYPSEPLDIAPSSPFARKVVDMMNLLGYNGPKWQYAKVIITRQLTKFGSAYQGNPIALKMYLTNLGIHGEHLDLIALEACGGDGVTTSLPIPGQNGQPTQMMGVMGGYNPFPPGLPGAGVQSVPMQAPQQDPFTLLERMGNVMKNFGWSPPGQGQQAQAPAVDPTAMATAMGNMMAKGAEIARPQGASSDGTNAILAAISKQNDTLLQSIIQGKQNQGQDARSILQELKDLGLVRPPQTAEEAMGQFKLMREMYAPLPQNVEMAKVQGQFTLDTKKLELEEKKIVEADKQRAEERRNQEEAFKRLSTLADRAIDSIAKPITTEIGKGIRESLAKGNTMPGMPGMPQPPPGLPANPADMTPGQRLQALEQLEAQARNARMQLASQMQPPPQAPQPSGPPSSATITAEKLPIF